MIYILDEQPYLERTFRPSWTTFAFRDVESTIDMTFAEVSDLLPDPEATFKRKLNVSLNKVISYKLRDINVFSSDSIHTSSAVLLDNDYFNRDQLEFSFGQRLNSNETYVLSADTGDLDNASWIANVNGVTTSRFVPWSELFICTRNNSELTTLPTHTTFPELYEHQFMDRVCSSLGN